MSGELNEEQIAQIRARRASRRRALLREPGAWKREIEQADIVAGPISPAALARATATEVGAELAGGDQRVLLYPEMIASPVTVTSCAGNGAIPLAEHAVMLMLMLAETRALAAEPGREQVGALVPPRADRPDVRHHRAGLLGAGPGAQAESVPHAGDRYAPNAPADPNVDEVFPRERLHDLLAQSDFVVMTAPRTPETTGCWARPNFG